MGVYIYPILGNSPVIFQIDEKTVWLALPSGAPSPVRERCRGLRRAASHARHPWSRSPFRTTCKPWLVCTRNHQKPNFLMWCLRGLRNHRIPCFLQRQNVNDSFSESVGKFCTGPTTNKPSRSGLVMAASASHHGTVEAKRSFLGSGQQLGFVFIVLPSLPWHLTFGAFQEIDLPGPLQVFSGGREGASFCGFHLLLGFGRSEVDDLAQRKAGPIHRCAEGYPQRLWGDSKLWKACHLFRIMFIYFPRLVLKGISHY